MNPPIASSVVLPPLPIRETKANVLRIAGVVVLITWLADFLFWNVTPGISVTIFAVAVAVFILLANTARWTPTLAGALLLLLGASAQSANELCFTNLTVLGVSMLALSR